MRLFVALGLPAAVEREIRTFVGVMGPRLPAARWVRPEGIHLTLVFLGEVAPDRLPALTASLAAAFAAHPPLTLAVRGGGIFPPRRPARVAWLGVDEIGAGALPALRADVARAALDSLGLADEERPFHPHLTLARVKAPWSRPTAETFIRAADRPFGEPFAVTEGALIESQLGPDGARYQVIESFSLESVTLESVTLEKG